MTLPRQVARDHCIVVGDVLDAEIVQGRLRLTPRDSVDRAILEGRRDYARGDYIGPFASVAELSAALDKPSRGKGRRGR